MEKEERIMKHLIATLSIGILLWGTTAPAAEKSLSDRQLESITAGQVGDNSPWLIPSKTRRRAKTLPPCIP